MAIHFYLAVVLHTTYYIAVLFMQVSTVPNAKRQTFITTTMTVIGWLAQLLAEVSLRINLNVGAARNQQFRNTILRT